MKVHVRLLPRGRAQSRDDPMPSQHVSGLLETQLSGWCLQMSDVSPSHDEKLRNCDQRIAVIGTETIVSWLSGWTIAIPFYIIVYTLLRIVNLYQTMYNEGYKVRVAQVLYCYNELNLSFGFFLSVFFLRDGR